MMLQQAQATFIFILRPVIIVDEDFLNLCVLSCVPPFLLNLMFFSKWGEGGFRVLDSLSSLFSLEKKLFVRTWVLASCIFFCPFVGCFVLLMIDKFSSNLRGFLYYLNCAKLCMYQKWHQAPCKTTILHKREKGKRAAQKLEVLCLFIQENNRFWVFDNIKKSSTKLILGECFFFLANCCFLNKKFLEIMLPVNAKSAILKDGQAWLHEKIRKGKHCLGLHICPQDLVLVEYNNWSWLVR